MSAKQMKGLNAFIMDLRNSRDLEQETKRVNLEINNIQSKFKHSSSIAGNLTASTGTNGQSAKSDSNTSLSGYQKKKYICKLIYIYLLGYNEGASFGIKEPLGLIASTVYSEKQIGYLAISVLFKRSPTTSLKEHLNDLMDVVHGSLLRDLQSNNQEFNCLALNFIASNFNVNQQDDSIDNKNNVVISEKEDNAAQWLEFTDLVYSFATSPIVSKSTKKKAVLALHVLFKLYPEVIINNNNWVPRILSLLEESEDLGLLTSSIPLIEYITLSITSKFAKSTMTSLARQLLFLLVDESCPKEYYYYSVPAPWLTIKLFTFVEHLFLMVDEKTGNNVLTLNDLDQTTINNLRLVISKAIQNSSAPAKGLPNRNSNSSILFQAVSLVVFLNASNDAVKGAINALILLLDSHETNTRYLSLDALIKLIARGSSTDQGQGGIFFIHEFEKLVPKLFTALHRDKDISVKRKALDLLYTICNGSNYIQIINGILEYIPNAEFILKGDLAIKVAVLSEKFATESTWYVTTMLKLISQGEASSSSSPGGGNVGNEIWERIVQIVVNNDDLQAQTCKKIISLCSQSNTVPENLIKVAGFILGEYGHLLRNEEKGPNGEDFSIVNQFQILYEAYFRVSLTTRTMLLTTFFKYFVNFPGEDFIPDIIDIFEIATQSIDLDIQTRGFEYLKLCTGDKIDRNILKSLVRPFPVFEKKTSSLMSRIGNVHKVIGRNRSSSYVNASRIREKRSNLTPPPVPPHASNSAKGLGKHSGSSLSLPVTEEDEGEYDNHQVHGDDTNDHDISKDAIDPFNDGDTEEPSRPPAAILSTNWYNGYHRMLQYDAGIFYEDQLIKILYRIVKDSFNIRYRFTIINNGAKTTGTNLTGFTILDLESNASSKDPNYLIQLENQPEQTIVDKSTFDVSIKVRNILENNESPVINISFSSGGSFNQLKLKFPVCFLRTLTSTNMINLDDFKKRWLQIGEQLPGRQGEHTSKVSTNYRCNSSNVVRLLSRLGFAVVHSTPDHTDAGILVMGAGILHSQKSNYGLLVTIRSTDNIGKEFEVIVRCTGGGISDVINHTLQEILEGKF